MPIEQVSKYSSTGQTIIRLWRLGDNTLEISDAVKMKEAQVYNFLARVRDLGSQDLRVRARA